MKTGRCDTRFCRNEAIKHRTKCHACRKRQWREKHPLEATFAARRDKAKARGILWLLTLEEFRDFCEQTDYLIQMGNDAVSMTIDRIENLRPYEVGNIQPLSRAKNSAKAQKADRHRMTVGLAWTGDYL